MSSSELLVYGLIVAAVIAINYVIQQAAQKAQREKARREVQQRADAVAQHDVGDYAWGRHPAPDVPERTEEGTHYEWGTGRAAVVVPAAEALPAARHRQEPELSREELLARQPRPPTDAKRPPWAPRRRGAAQRLFATREDLHRAVIAMTVLGPCRAIESPEPQDPGRTRPRAH